MIITVKIGKKQNFVTEGGMYEGFPIIFLNNETWVREGFNKEELKEIILRTLTSGKEDKEILVEYVEVPYEYECIFTGKMKKDVKLLRKDGNIAYPTSEDFDINIEESDINES